MNICPTCGADVSEGDEVCLKCGAKFGLPPPVPQVNLPHIVIADITIPFMSLVILLVKVSIAAIPAALFIYVIFAVIVALLGGFASVR